MRLNEGTVKLLCRKQADMIIDSEGMKEIEQASGISVNELMERAGTAIADALKKEIKEGSDILILCGKGNNGGDGFVIARLLSKQYHVHVCLADGKPVTPAAKAMHRRLPKKCIIKAEDIDAVLTQCDAVVDAVYGFGYHGSLSSDMKNLFRKVSASGKPVYAVDVNSGCECDTGRTHTGALHSTITYAIDCCKPFHVMYKDHHMFDRVELVSLNLPHDKGTTYTEMDEDSFFAHFPKKNDNAYKGTYGKTLLISGSYGMAGAACLNILGAKTMGASYIESALPDEVYPIVASHFITPVFHPFGHESWHEVLEPLVHSAKATAFGSGCVYMDRKEDILDLVLQNATGPVVLDAEALRLLKHNTWVLRFAHSPVILTPHIGEFSDLSGLPTEVILADRFNVLKKFARENGVIVVLKDPHTVVASPSGDIYINQTGNQALAQAGSGDVLTGIMAALLTMTSDVWTAVCMAVWIHGKLSELGTEKHSIQGFSLEEYPSLMDAYFKQHGF